MRKMFHSTNAARRRMSALLCASIWLFSGAMTSSAQPPMAPMGQPAANTGGQNKQLTDQIAELRGQVARLQASMNQTAPAKNAGAKPGMQMGAGKGMGMMSEMGEMGGMMQGKQGGMDGMAAGGSGAMAPAKAMGMCCMGAMGMPPSGSAGMGPMTPPPGMPGMAAHVLKGVTLGHGRCDLVSTRAPQPPPSAGPRR